MEWSAWDSSVRVMRREKTIVEWVFPVQAVGKVNHQGCGEDWISTYSEVLVSTTEEADQVVGML